MNAIVFKKFIDVFLTMKINYQNLMNIVRVTNEN